MLQIIWHSYKVGISMFNFGGKIMMKHTWSLFSTVCLFNRVCNMYMYSCTLSNKKNIYFTPYVLYVLCNEQIFDGLQFLFKQNISEQIIINICSLLNNAFD